MRHELGDKNRILHILEAISNIEIILEGINRKQFQNNLEKRLSIERLLQIIGEATNHISDEILYKENHSAPWRKIIAIRNVIVHEYFRLDYDVLYDIVKNEIVPLKIEIQSILKGLEKENTQDGN